MKAEFDRSEKLFEKDMESISVALESAATTEGELQEVKAELKTT